ncbi:hypothetical protein [Pantoea sp. paga]|uniref:hypothetical protein n=1 Tax=Pantoea sp. paga TaxID=2597519 RepID=UPI002104AF82|nr:hypothetical protein [Pantoea sp. paga]
MSFVLNCSGRGMVLHSLCEGFRCPVSELQNELLGIDVEAAFASDPDIMVSANQFLYKHICSRLGQPDEVVSAYWFHGTRTAAANQFNEGILPLNRSAEAVIRMLAECAPDSTARTRISAWAVSSVPDDMFQLRHGNATHWGPYGSLVREVQLNNEETKHHNYSTMPELVEDVCNAYREEYGADLKQHYLAVLKPRIIWFIAPPPDRQRCIEAALAYAYTSVRDLPPDSCANWGIDRKGIAVPPEDIVQVEDLP